MFPSGWGVWTGPSPGTRICPFPVHVFILPVTNHPPPPFPCRALTTYITSPCARYPAAMVAMDSSDHECTTMRIFCYFPPPVFLRLLVFSPLSCFLLCCFFLWCCSKTLFHLPHYLAMAFSASTLSIPKYFFFRPFPIFFFSSVSTSL